LLYFAKVVLVAEQPYPDRLGSLAIHSATLRDSVPLLQQQ